MKRGELASNSDDVLIIDSVLGRVPPWLGSVAEGGKRWTVLLALVFAPAMADGQPVCPGDCDADAIVEINELIIGVNISLGRNSVASCGSLDTDANGAVAINELVVAVRGLLNGCSTESTRSPTEVSSTPTRGTSTRTEAPATVTPTPTDSIPAANGAIELRVLRANDGTLYYVIGVDLASGSVGIGAQINSVVMSDGAVQDVQEPFAAPDRVLTAFAGAISGSAVPASRVVRTNIISGLSANDIVLDNPPNLANGEFDPGANDGSGLLTLPGGQLAVSIDGSAGTAIVSAQSASGSGVAFVPGATVTTIRRQFRNNTIRAETLVFPNPAGAVQTSASATCGLGDPVPCDPSLPMPAVCGGAPCTVLGGEVADQNVTVDDTIGTRVGNEAAQRNEVDGFFLHAGSDLIVFMVKGASGPAPVNAAAAGFVVYGSCVGGPNDAHPCSSPADCPGSSCGDGVRSRSVAAAIGGRGVQIMLPLPPTATPTYTPTPTVPGPPGQRSKTGQTTCYSASGEIACAGTGQDGELQKGLAPVYVDNGDGTITDATTGLMWEKLADDGTSFHDKDRVYTWLEAFSSKIAALNGLNFAGHNDWRLPNVNELQSLTNYGRENPAVDSTFNLNCEEGCQVASCSCILPLGYWSSTTNQSSLSNNLVWRVDFMDGVTTMELKGSQAYARAVRNASGTPPGQRLQTGQTACFNAAGGMIACAGTGQDGELRRGLARAYADNGDGTITDTRSGLVWEKLSDDGSIHDKDNTYGWANAFDVKIDGLNSGAGFAGYKDWRLPNVNELQSLVDYGRGAPAVDPSVNASCAAGCSVTTCSCTKAAFYWTSTSSLSGAVLAWFVDFDTGELSRTLKQAALAVRAVRGGS